MKKLIALFVSAAFAAVSVMNAVAAGKSVYTQKPDDPGAVFFDPAEYGVRLDGKVDVTLPLQQAIDKVKNEQGFGILFLPEGKYLISSTLYIPGAVRVIGYGSNRPEIILAKNAPGFQAEQNYMVWFTGGVVQEGRPPVDANAGTFYSALSNINFRILDGNPTAVALRTHFAQHGYVSHCDVHTGNGYAGLYDVGNEMEDMNFYGGQYGIVSNRPSPSWPMAMVDVNFDGHKTAAIKSIDAALAIVNMTVRNTPVGIEIPKDVNDHLYIEHSLFENVGTAVIIGAGMGAGNKINIVDTYFKKVPVTVSFTHTGEKIASSDKMYKVSNFVFGLVQDGMDVDSDYATICEMEPVASLPDFFKSSLPVLPAMSEWKSVRDFGAVGDGETDDTEAIRKAIESCKAVYFPTGWYRITSPVKMQEGTALIGLHPFATQILIGESTPAFSGFGAPVPLVESSAGGDDIITGIGINGGAMNTRAVGVKWLAGAGSYMNDVKFVGGHGTMSRPVPGGLQGGFPGGFPGGFFNFQMPKPSSPTSPVYNQGMDQAWDTQHWSLWVTDNGGGTFKDIWTADTYASTGFYVSHTSTPSRVYAMSLEHHVRFECRLNDVHNWKFYAMQFEEESREGPDCQQLVVDNCSDLQFANLWFYRVVRVSTPRPYGILVSGSSNVVIRNMYNRTQILYPTEITAYDMNKNLALHHHEFAYGIIRGDEKSRRVPAAVDVPERLGFGYEFATGAVSDSKDNVYFCEGRLRKIYRYDASTGTINLFADFPSRPMSLAVDTQDNLIVICRYYPQMGYMIDGKQEAFREKLPDDYADYSGWGNSGWATYAYSIAPDGSDNMIPLAKVPTSSVANVSRVIVPSHRLRDNFDEVAQAMPSNSFVALDGVTIIPETYDLTRSVQLTSYAPGQSDPVYVSCERTFETARFSAGADGRLTLSGDKIKRGAYAVAYSHGKAYIAEGQIFVVNSDNNIVEKRITVEESPLSLAISPDGHYLYYTTSSSFYRVRL